MRYLIGCDLALKKSSVLIYDIYYNSYKIILFTNRKKLLKQKNYTSFDGLFKINYYDSNLSMDDKIIIIFECLLEIKSEIKTLNIEGYSYQSIGNSMYQIGEFIGIFKHQLRLSKIYYNIIQPKALKKFAGNGNADKSKMFEFIKNKTFKDYIQKFADLNKIKIYKDGPSDVVDSYHLALFK